MLNKKYFIIPGLLAIAPNVLAFPVVLYLIMTRTGIEHLPGPILIYMWFHQLYMIVPLLILDPMGIRITANKSEEMVFFASILGLFCAVLVYGIIAAAINKVCKVRLKVSVIRRQMSNKAPSWTP